MRQCRKRRHAPKVPVYEYRSEERGERVATEGVATCKSRLCAFCRIKWQRVRSKEIRLAIDFWNRGGLHRVFFVTVTMRHNKSLSLALMRRLITAAWGSLWTGREGQALAKKLGGKPEMIRADDDTFSFEARWHPHGHGLIFMQRDGHTAEELEEIWTERWRKALFSALKTFQDNVVRVLEGRPCRVWNRHRGALRTRYDKEATRPCSPVDDPDIRQILPGRVLFKAPAPSPSVEVIADDRAGLGMARGELLELLRARGTGTGAVGSTGRGTRALRAVQWRVNYDAGKTKKSAPAFCCADDGRGQEAINPSVYVKRFRRVCDRVSDARGVRWVALACKPESTKINEDNDDLADKIEQGRRDPWDWILGVPQCWDCEKGQECAHLRARMEKVFGRRMVRPHRTLVDSARDIERRLRRFTKKAIEPNRKYGVKVEDIRSGGLDTYLTKLGAMDTLHLELAHGSSKLGSLGEDGLMHYSPPQLQAIAAIHGHPKRVEARQAYGELVRATFGLQPITFSSRPRLGLGPDPYGDNAEDPEPDERDVMLEAARVLRVAAGELAREGLLPFELEARRLELLGQAEELEAKAENAGETKRFLGNIDGPKWDELVKEGEARAEAGEGEGFLAELVQLHAEWRLEGAEFLEPPDEEAGKPVRLKAATGPPAPPGPFYGWARHIVEMEIRQRVHDRFEKRADDRAAARMESEPDGGALPAESAHKVRARLRAWFEEMRRADDAQ